MFGLEIMFGAENIRVEDCIFRNLSLGIYLSNGGSTERPNRIKIFRNTFAYNWANSEINYGNRAFGILGGGFSNVEINQNFFYRNGWHPMIFTSIRTGFSHNVYLAGHAENLRFEDNFSVDASSMGLKIRSADTNAYSNMKLNRNVFIKNPIGMGLGVEPRPTHHQYSNFEVNDNIITENGYVGSLPPYGNTNWAITFGSGANGEFVRNLLVHNMSPTNAIAVRIDPYPSSNVQWRENVIHRYAGNSGIQNNAPSGIELISNRVSTNDLEYEYRNPDYTMERYCQELSFSSCEEFYSMLLNRPANYWDYVYSTELVQIMFRSAYTEVLGQ